MLKLTKLETEVLLKVSQKVLWNLWKCDGKWIEPCPDFCCALTNKEHQALKRVIKKLDKLNN